MYTDDKIYNSVCCFEQRGVVIVLFEQVLATVDYRIFVRIMAQKNLELQQQALLLISQMLGGSLPESLLKDAPADVQWSKSQHHSKDEDQILLAVLAQSKEEYEREKKQTSDEQEELRVIIGISQSESARLKHSMQVEQEKLNETLQKSLTINDEAQTTGKTVSSKPTLSKSASIPPPASYQPKRQSSTTTAPKQIMADHSVGAKDAGSTVSSADAAAAWMKSAETEMNASDAHSKAVQAAAASMAGMSGEEYKRRVEFLRQQRDKLMEMKRKEREKQLLSAEKSQPQRPASARAARVALKQGHGNRGPETNPEDEKKLAMRRAIADRIKSELMGKK